MNSSHASCQDARLVEFGRTHRLGLLTIVFTDIVGSMRLKQELGDEAAIRVIKRHHALVRRLLAGFREAEEIETAGDSFLLVFARPSEALLFALRLVVQLQAFAQETVQETGQVVADRIGIHVGEVVIDEEQGARKLFGTPVDTCFRVMALASASQILMTRFAFDTSRQVLRGTEIEGVKELRWLNHGNYRFKGVEEPVEVCEVRVGAGGCVTPPTNTEKAQRVSGDADLVLGWRPAVGLAVPGTDWELQEKLGEGGFGEVWLGCHRHFKEQRVFKFCFHADRVRSLKREVKLIGLLREKVGEHPNIVGLHDVFFEQPPYYLEEEYVDGRDVRRWCDLQGGVGAVPMETRLEIVAQAAEGLQAAHDAGVLHRDVKPGNMLITGSPDRAGPSPPAGHSPLRVKLTDFGIGQVISSEVLAGQTRAGFTETILPLDSPLATGTQLYMAPELFAGKPASIRSDIYALGVVLYQLLVGDFQRPVTTEWALDIEDPLLQDDLRRCFSGHPSERFAGAGQLAEHLRTLPARRKARIEQQERMAARERAAYRRGMARTAVVAGVIVAVIAALAWQVRSTGLDNLRQAAQIRSTAVRLTLANGQSLAERSDWLDAALWFAEAFVLDEGFQTALEDRENRQNHLLRLNSVLRQLPRLERMWFDERYLSDSALPGAGSSAASTGYEVGYVCGGLDQTGSYVLLGGIGGHQLYSTVSGQVAGPRIGEGSTRASLRPDGRRAVTGGGATNAVYRVWDLSVGTPLFLLQALESGEPFQGECSDLRFSPDGSYIAAAVEGQEGRAIIWDAETGRARRVIAYADAADLERTEDASILSVRFDGPGERLLTAGKDGRAIVWEWRTGRVLQVLRGHWSWIYVACFGHQNTNWAVTCSFDRTARLWDLRTGEQLHQVEHEGDAIYDVQFSPDDRSFVTGGLDSTVRLWESETGQLIPPIIRDHGRVTQVRWRPNGSGLVTISWDGVARLWRFGGEKELVRDSANEHTPDGRYALSIENGRLRVQETVGDRLVNMFPLTASEVPVWCMAGPANHVLCFSAPTGSTRAKPEGVQLWRISQGTPVGTPLRYDRSWSHCRYAAKAQRIAFYRGKKSGAGARADQAVVVWEPERSIQPRRIAFTNEEVTAVTFSPDGRRLAVASFDRQAGEGVLRLVDLEVNDSVISRWRSQQEFPDVAFSADGRWLAAAQSDNTLGPGSALLWRLDHTGAPAPGEPADLPHADGVLCVAFSDSEQLIATGSEDQTAIVWRWTEGTWRPSPRPLRCGGQVHACAFSRNRRWLATAHRSPRAQQSELWRSVIRIWDTATSEPLTLPLSFVKKVTRLGFVADDTQLFVEHWAPPDPPQRWIIDLPVNEGSAQDFLLGAELLSAQRSFLSGEAWQFPRQLPADVSVEEALAHVTGVGHSRRLGKEDCWDLWRELAPETVTQPHVDR